MTRGGIRADTHQREQHNDGAVQTKCDPEVLHREACDERDDLHKERNWHQYGWSLPTLRCTHSASNQSYFGGLFDLSLANKIL